MENKVILSKRNVSTISFGLGIPMGGAYEPKLGLTTILFNHLQRNTQKKNEAELAKTFDKHGISSFGYVGKTSTLYGMTCPPKNLDKAIELYSEMIFEPAFDEATITKLVQQQKGMLMQLQQMANAKLQIETRWKSAYGNSLIANNAQGTAESLDSITVEDLESHYKNLFDYNVNFGSVGVDVDESKFSGLDPVFTKFASKKQNVKLNETIIRKETLVEKTTAPSMNNYISVNMHSVGNNNSNLADVIFNSVLSGGFSAKMFTEIRDNRNLSYGPFSQNSKFRDFGLISAGMDVLPERTAEAVEVTLNIIKETLTEKTSEGVLNRAIKSAQRVSVFITDSAQSYTTWLLDKLGSGTEWDMEKEKKLLIDISQGEWQENILKYFKAENMTLGVVGKYDTAQDDFTKLIEEVF